jgi:hypothetical protein
VQLCRAVGGRNERNGIPDEQVELAVAVHVGGPDASRARGAGQILLAEEFSILDRPARFDEPFERGQVGRLALSLDPVEGTSAKKALELPR